jgi:hypothetical protein
MWRRIYWCLGGKYRIHFQVASQVSNKHSKSSLVKVSVSTDKPSLEMLSYWLYSWHFSPRQADCLLGRRILGPDISTRLNGVTSSEVIHVVVIAVIMSGYLLLESVGISILCVLLCFIPMLEQFACIIIWGGRYRKHSPGATAIYWQESALVTTILTQVHMKVL